MCKKVVAFFQLLAESQETGVRRLGVTQELLSLVTGLAHYLKLLIRICLQGALKLERETDSQEGLTRFLEDIGTLEEKLEIEGGRDSRLDTEGYVSRAADNCAVCSKSVEDRCFALRDRRFHGPCLVCAKCARPVGSENIAETRWDEAQQKVLCERHAPPTAVSDFAQVTRLQQYVHLLRVAHARLLATLRTSGALPHTSGLSINFDYCLTFQTDREPQMTRTWPTMTLIKAIAYLPKARQSHHCCAQIPGRNLTLPLQGEKNHHPTSRRLETSDDYALPAWTSNSQPLIAGHVPHVSSMAPKV